MDDFKRLFSDVQGFIAGLSEESVLEEGCQPRLPWQDVHCRIEGPAVHDVFANFIRRWNVAVKENADNTALGLDRRTGLDHKEGKTGQGYANNDAAGSRQMDGVLEAMLHAVNRAQAYLYIETQFFISHCGLSDKHEEPIAKNPRFRGLGFEMRTDAWGVVRGGRGVGAVHHCPPVAGFAFL